MKITLPHQSPVRVLFVVNNVKLTDDRKSKSPARSAGECFLQMTQFFHGVNYVTAGEYQYV